MLQQILPRRRGADDPPDLTENDIPWGRHGLSVGVIEEPADASTFRDMLREALTIAATLTARCRQYELVVVQLREELRALRASRAA